MERERLRLSQLAITPLAGAYSNPDGGGRNTLSGAHGYVLEGRMVVKMDDGAQVEYGPGDAFYMPPGHDAWIVGDKRCVLIDFTGVAKYAKPA